MAIPNNGTVVEAVVREAAREDGITILLAWRQLVRTVKRSHGGRLPPDVRQDLIAFHRELVFYTDLHDG